MMVNRDCIMANLEQRDCKGLKELFELWQKEI